MKAVFQDRAISFEEQVDLLQSQGLEIEDRERALHVLQNISYSRFKSYLIPLMADRSANRFRPGATFEQAYTIYGFDRRLRELIFHELEKVEISIRTRFGYASASGDAGYWFINPSYFKYPDEHRSLLKRIQSEVNRSDNDAIARFFERYSNELPPCWMTLEATSMGTLSSIYDAMKSGDIKRTIAEYYDVATPVFASWLHHLVYVRNTCAHHSRVWNKTLSIQAMVPNKPHRPFPRQAQDAPQHIYLTLCIIKYLQDKVKPTNTFAQRLRALMDNFPFIDARAMGFPADWKDDPFWAV